MLCVAVEGTVCAGKTTLIQTLRNNHDFFVVDEYGFYTGGSEKFPSFPPMTVAEAIDASRFFVSIEALRIQDYGMKTTSVPPVALLDRSYLTCLAFDFATEVLTGFKIIDQTSMIWTKSDKIEPDICLYLDISDETRLERSKQRGCSIHTIFFDKEFNKRFRRFFWKRRQCHCRVEWIDANQSADQIANIAMSAIQKALIHAR